MIYTRDSHGKYWHQLTQPEKEIPHLEYALEAFRGDILSNCVIKQHIDTEEYAVFTTGQFLENERVPINPAYVTVQTSQEVHYEV